MLLVRLLLAPLLIAIASLVGRRYGPAVGGWFAAFPLTSGPVILIFAIERGAAFTADACGGVLLAIAPLVVFALVYAWSAQRTPWTWSSALSCLAYVGTAWCATRLTLTHAAAFAFDCVVLIAALRLMPRRTADASRLPPTTWDIPLRMLLAAVLVFAVTSVATAVGPRASGLLTPFPVATTLLVAFTHYFEGGAAAARLLRSLLAGLFSFALFFLIVGTAIEPWGTLPAFTAGAIGILAMQGLVLRVVANPRSPA
jgi:hypothetical protein